MMMSFSGGIAGFLWSLVMIISMALPFIILFWVALALGERLKERNGYRRTPLAVLKTRLAKGEISLDDFYRLREQINLPVFLKNEISQKT